eukprot:2025704-Pyramimonas_sp.AAC.1
MLWPTLARWRGIAPPSWSTWFTWPAVSSASSCPKVTLMTSTRPSNGGLAGLCTCIWSSGRTERRA